MTVTFKEEISESRRARNTAGSRSYTRAFRLETSLQSEDAYDVGSHASLPVIGDTFPSDLNAYCHDIQIDNSDPWKGWIATYEYSDKRQVTPAATAGTGVIDEITYELSSQIYQDTLHEAREVELFGVGPLKAVMNPAGSKFPDPLVADFASLVFKVKFNMTFVPADTFLYLNSINDGAININGVNIPKGKAKFHGVNVGSREIRGVRPDASLIAYYPVTYEIYARPSGWTTKKRNEGWMERGVVGVDGAIVPVNILDEKGEPVMEVSMLDHLGKKQLNPTADNATYTEYLPYPEKNFKLLIGVN
jgi:hypothetical protein